MRLRIGADMAPLKTNSCIASAGRVGTVAPPLVRVRLIATTELASKVNARNIPTGCLAPGDALQPALEDRAVPIELERQRDPPSERVLQTLPDDAAASSSIDSASPQGV